MILSILMLCSASLVSAQYVSLGAGVDVRNAIIGSEPTQNQPAFNGLLQFSMVGEEGIKVDITYEKMPKIDFERYSIGFGFIFPLYAHIRNKQIVTNFIPSLSPTIISRKGYWGGGISKETNSAHITLGLNLSLNWRLSDSFAVEYTLNMLPRTDLSAMYPKEAWKDRVVVNGVPVVGSSFIKLIYVIPI